MSVPPGFYTTTYQETFKDYSSPKTNIRPSKNKFSVFSSQSTSPFFVSGNEPFPEHRSDYGAFPNQQARCSPKIVKANVEKSGFWAESPIHGSSTQHQDVMKTTYQDEFSSNHNSDVFQNLKQVKGVQNKIQTPFDREPITISSEDPMYNQSVEHSMYSKKEKTSQNLPTNVVMQETGYRRSFTTNKSSSQQNKTSLTEAEIRKFQHIDPVEYRSARMGDNTMMSVNQLFYQDPRSYQK